MNANELKLGNYINWIGRKEDARIMNGSDFDLVYIDLEDNEIENKSFKAIPLTEKWLLDFGFKDGVTLDNDKYKIDIDYYDGWIFNYKEKEKFGHADVFLYPSNIYYVHQLQNLVFSLTNEELKRVDGF